MESTSTATLFKYDICFIVKNMTLEVLKVHTPLPNCKWEENSRTPHGLCHWYSSLWLPTKTKLKILSAASVSTVKTIVINSSEVRIIVTLSWMIIDNRAHGKCSAKWPGKSKRRQMSIILLTSCISLRVPLSTIYWMVLIQGLQHSFMWADFSPL